LTVFKRDIWKLVQAFHKPIFPFRRQKHYISVSHTFLYCNHFNMQHGHLAIVQKWQFLN
jgi:hypothetical protein